MSGGLTPAAQIQALLQCDPETARTVERNLGGVMQHEPTRAFIALSWNLARSTYDPSRGQFDMAIREGRRQCAMFLASCGSASLDLDIYTDTAPKEDKGNV